MSKLIFCLILKVDFCLTNVNLRVSKWFAKYLVNLYPVIKTHDNIQMFGADRFASIFCSVLVGSGRCRLCLTRCRSFQVVSCSLQVVSDGFLPFVGRFTSFGVLVSNKTKDSIQNICIFINMIKMSPVILR